MFLFVFFFSAYSYHRDLPVLTHSVPTLRSSDLPRDRLRAEAIRIAIRKAPAAGQLRKPLETLLDAGRIINADRSHQNRQPVVERVFECVRQFGGSPADRKSTRLNSSH